MHGLALDPRSDDLAGVRPSPHIASLSSLGGEDEDATLVRRCRNGDTQSFGVLVTRHERRVSALVSRVLGPSATPDDLADTVQDIFVQVWRTLPRYRGDALFATWLYRVATNMAIKQWRRGKRRQMVMGEEELPAAVRLALADPKPQPADVVERRARDRALRAAIETLPEKQRTVVLLHYFEDCTCEQIAQFVGCSVGTVWSRLHYAVRKLRSTLSWLEIG